MTQEAEQIMKRCQTGTFSYEESNNLHAACYGIIGKLLAQRKPLTKKRLYEIFENADQRFNRGDDMNKLRMIIARAIEADHGIKGEA